MRIRAAWKRLRLQNADLLTEYNLIESDLQRPKVKEADFRGKAPGAPSTRAPAGDAVHAGDDRQSRCQGGGALSCRQHAGDGPGDRRDAGRRTRPPLISPTSVAYGPTIGKNIALAYLPHAWCEVGRKLEVEYFGETYPVEVAGVGYKPLYDPENLKPRS